MASALAVQCSTNWAVRIHTLTGKCDYDCYSRSFFYVSIPAVYIIFLPDRTLSELSMTKIIVNVTNNKMNFEKLLSYQVFKNHNYNPFQYHLKFVHVFLILYLLHY